MTRLLLALALLVCKERSTSVPVETAPAATVTNDIAAVAKPVASNVERVPPAKPIAWTKPARAASDQERLLAGTWVATVGEYASRSRFMADRVVLGVTAKGTDAVTAITKALEDDTKLQTNCVWLELRPDFTGIRRECALVNGTASALDNTDAVTGKKTDLGTTLSWFIDDGDKNAIKIRFDADMVVPAAGPTGVRQLVFRHWTLRFAPDANAGENRFRIVEAFPEHDYELPQRYVFEIFSGSYLD